MEESQDCLLTLGKRHFGKEPNGLVMTGVKLEVTEKDRNVRFDLTLSGSLIYSNMAIFSNSFLTLGFSKHPSGMGL